MTKLALQANSCYNDVVKILCLSATANSLRREFNLSRRRTMDTLYPHAENGNTPLKRCSKCEQFKPATTEFFPRTKSNKAGLKSWCKLCSSAYNRQYNVNHREEISAQRKVYYQDHREHLKQYSAQYRIENHEKVHQYDQQYRRSDRRKIVKARYDVTHSEQRKIYKNKWHQEHREEQQQYCAKYNTEHRRERIEYGKKRRIEHREELNAKHRVYRRTERGRMMHRVHENRRRARKLETFGSYTAQDLQAQYKNQKGKCYYCHKKLGKQYHADHVVPLSRGGSNDRSNIVVACPMCNIRKNNKLPHEWGEGGRLL